jgi:PIN domain nuclease of toxin-antitoxin system
VSRYLVDTHVWLWLQTEPERIQTEVREMVEDTGTEIMLSAASAWEITIKYGVGKLPLPREPAIYVPDRMRMTGTTPLAVEHAHVLRTGELPMHHRDPFDRLLVAQAQILNIPIMTSDPQIAAYDVEVVPA